MPSRVPRLKAPRQPASRDRPAQDSSGQFERQPRQPGCGEGADSALERLKYLERDRLWSGPAR